MKSFGYGPAMRRLPAALMILGAVLLLAACSSGGNGEGVGDPAVPAGDMAQMAESPMAETPMAETPMAELGEWNDLMAGSLRIRDANRVLDVHYDGDAGHIVVWHARAAGHHRHGRVERQVVRQGRAGSESPDHLWV